MGKVKAKKTLSIRVSAELLARIDEHVKRRSHIVGTPLPREAVLRMMLEEGVLR